MPVKHYSIRGSVAQLVTIEELVINRGTRDGVIRDMIFDVLDPLTQDVKDPDSGEILGSIDRILARVRITEVEERISVGQLVSRRPLGLSETARALAGQSARYVRPTGDAWPEGVQAGDPVGFANEFWKKDSEKEKEPPKEGA